MARTFVPAWDEPIHMTMEQVRDLIRETLVHKQGDADKAGDPEDGAYYQGGVDVCNDLLMTMTFPRTEQDARECQHSRKVWFGNECGDCEVHGYVWKDQS
jgi:hypothetical protein